MIHMVFIVVRGYGPYFGDGNDLILNGTNFQTNSKCYSRQKSYQLPIMNGAENNVNFSVEEYEVFQVIKDDNIYRI